MINFAQYQSNPLQQAMSAASGLQNIDERNMMMEGIRNKQKLDEQAALDLKRQQSPETIQQAAQILESGSIEDIVSFRMQNPETVKFMTDELSRQKGVNKDELVQLSKSLLTDPDGAEAAFNDRIEMITARGGNPVDTIAQRDMYRADPAGYLEKQKRFLAFEDEAAYDAYAKTQPKQPEAMTEYQKGTLDVQKEQNRLRALEAEEKKLDRQAARAKTEAQVKEVEAKRESLQKEKVEAQAQDKTKIEGTIYTIGESKRAVDDLLLNDEFLDDLTGLSGVAQGYGFRPTEDAREAQILFNNITSQQTLDNLGKMSGPLTDKDVEVIRQASNRIKEGMSKESMKVELQKIKDAYERIDRINREEAKRKGYELNDSDVYKGRVEGEITSSSGTTFRVIK